MPSARDTTYGLTAYEEVDEWVVEGRGLVLTELRATGQIWHDLRWLACLVLL